MSKEAPQLTIEQKLYIDQHYKANTKLDMARRFKTSLYKVTQYCKAKGYVCKGSKKGIGRGNPNKIKQAGFNWLMPELDKYFK